MARKPRIEFAGAIYHVLNRGNYRADLFDSAGAAQAFIDCLFQACERMDWRLHAYCVMRNHYHLAIETPGGNLVAGVHWLQSTFGNRFNRFRGEHGRAFQGRYQAIVVEPGLHLARLVDYIHLNPVRKNIVPLEQLSQFRWSSYRHFIRGPVGRPEPLVCADWLAATNGLADTTAGWAAYESRLAWLMADEGRQKEAAFDRMCRGWVLGSDGYKQDLLKDFKKLTKAQDWGGGEMAEINQTEWRRMLEQGARKLGQDLSTCASAPKASPWKVALATWLKRGTSVTNRWLGEQLLMGQPDAVSRYTSECVNGQRPEANKLTDRLTTRIRG